MLKAKTMADVATIVEFKRKESNEQYEAALIKWHALKKDEAEDVMKRIKMIILDVKENRYA